MLLEFTKMNGPGNDFIFLDNRAGKIQLTPGQIVRLCDRHRGVGADGVMLLRCDRMRFPFGRNKITWWTTALGGKRTDSV